MDLQTRKIQFIQEFLKISNEDSISMFETLLKRQKEKLHNPFTKEEMVERVMQSELDFKEGRFKSTEELLERFQ